LLIILFHPGIVPNQAGPHKTWLAERLQKISGIERGTTWLLRRVECIGPCAAEWSQSMLNSRGIEGVRVLMGLLSLANKHSRQAVEDACRIAVGHGAYRLRSLRQIIEHHNQTPVQQSFEFIQQHAIIRDLGDYAQFVRHAITNAEALPSAQPTKELSP
jgi:hypothetical protein